MEKKPKASLQSSIPTSQPPKKVALEVNSFPSQAICSPGQCLTTLGET